MKPLAVGMPTREQSVSLGFQRSNLSQLSCHLLLAIFIGVTLRLTTFTEATTIAAEIGDDYKVKTAFLVAFGFTKAFSNLLVGRVSDVYGRKAPHAVGWMFGILLGVLLLAITSSSVSNDTSDERYLFLISYCNPTHKKYWEGF